eukprot:scaffold1991_cov218-Pinguiococcus_pyrenoidosus.AAC.3
MPTTGVALGPGPADPSSARCSIPAGPTPSAEAHCAGDPRSTRAATCGRTAPPPRGHPRTRARPAGRGVPPAPDTRRSAPAPGASDTRRRADPPAGTASAASAGPSAGSASGPPRTGPARSPETWISGSACSAAGTRAAEAASAASPASGPAAARPPATPSLGTSRDLRSGSASACWRIAPAIRALRRRRISAHGPFWANCPASPWTTSPPRWACWCAPFPERTRWSSCLPRRALRARLAVALPRRGGKSRACGHAANLGDDTGVLEGYLGRIMAAIELLQQLDLLLELGTRHLRSAEGYGRGAGLRGVHVCHLWLDELVVDQDLRSALLGQGAAVVAGRGVLCRRHKRPRGPQEVLSPGWEVGSAPPAEVSVQVPRRLGRAI